MGWSLQAQPTDFTVVRLPILFGQFEQAYSIANPAANGSLRRFSVSLLAQQSAFSEISSNTYWLNINEAIGDEYAYHNGALMFWQDNAGDFLKLTRGYLAYSFHKYVGNSYYLAAGVSGGLVNYKFEEYDYAVYNDQTLDANVGIMLHDQDHLQVGLSVGQIVGGHLQPISQVTQLAPYYTLFFINRYTLGISSIELEPKAMYRTVKDATDDKLLSLDAFFSSYLRVGLGIISNDFFIFSLGLDEWQLDFGDQQMAIRFLYNLPIAKDYEQALFELGIRLYRKE